MNNNVPNQKKEGEIFKYRILYYLEFILSKADHDRAMREIPTLLGIGKTQFRRYLQATHQDTRHALSVEKLQKIASYLSETTGNTISINDLLNKKNEGGNDE